MIGETIKVLHLDVNTAYAQDIDKLIWFFDSQKSLTQKENDKSVDMFDWIKSGDSKKFLDGKDN